MKMFNSLKNLYVSFKHMNFDKILSYCLLEKMYFDVKHRNKFKELHNKKRICKKILKIYTSFNKIPRQ